LLPSCIASQRVRQMEMIDKLVQRECRVLRHGLQPQALAEKFAGFCRR
jgi:hypothetical protein